MAASPLQAAVPTFHLTPMRPNGSIAAGGIVSTVAATRASSEAELVAGAMPRLDALIGEGVTTLEIKSGYGLNTETEMRQLSAARALGGNRPITIRTSFL